MNLIIIFMHKLLIFGYFVMQIDKQILEINFDDIDANIYEVPIEVEDDVKEDVGGVEINLLSA